jgi:hypothetical protein
MIGRKNLIITEVGNPRTACHIVCEADRPNASYSPQFGWIFRIPWSLRGI